MSELLNHQVFKLQLPHEDELIKQIRLTSEIVWKKNLSKIDINEWLSNFRGEVFEKSYEDQLALWLLANFVFYNEEEVKHLCKTMYRDFIHNLMISSRGADDIDSVYNDILQECRFFHLGKPGESSGYVLYYFRQNNELPIKKFISDLNSIESIIKTIVFVDDVVLSEGKKSQAGKYINELRDKYAELKKRKIIILAFIATVEAIEYLRDENIEVINCITLDERHKCFHPQSMVFSHFNEHLHNAEKFARHYGMKIKPNNPLGHNDGQFLFGFFYNTPDNTLPIFWAEENNWIPIRKRYHKNYHSKLIDLGKYI
jgi:hypothetical protein